MSIPSFFWDKTSDELEEERRNFSSGDVVIDLLHPDVGEFELIEKTEREGVPCWRIRVVPKNGGSTPESVVATQWLALVPKDE